MMYFRNRSHYAPIKWIIFFLLLHCITLFAANDSIPNRIGVSVGMNYTNTNIKSDLEFNNESMYNSGYGLYIEGFYNIRCFKKCFIETNLLFEQRNTRDRQTFEFIDIAGNITGSTSYIKQTNKCFLVSPLFFYNINNFLSIGAGPSLNYLLGTVYNLGGPFGKAEAYHYKQFQPEINTCFKVTMKSIAISLKYSTSLMDKVKGLNHSIKEYDRVLRLGVGYLFGLNKTKQSIK